MNQPVCTIIAGPNGAGKTTLAMELLPQTSCRTFLNADLIASGLAPFQAQETRLEAAKLLLRKIEHCIAKRETFSFETTLSGRSHLPRVRRMIRDGWHVNLIYLWLPSAEASANRVRERVRQGGHTIPKHDIYRRYGRSLKNLLHYAPVCSAVKCIDNSTMNRQLIFRQQGENVTVMNEYLYAVLHETANLKQPMSVKEPYKAYEVAGEDGQRPAVRRIEDVDTGFILKALGDAVTKELERKRRLGYDAIIVEDGTIMRLHPDGSKTPIGPV